MRQRTIVIRRIWIIREPTCPCIRDLTKVIMRSIGTRLAIGRMTEIIMRTDMMRHIITILTTIPRMYLISSGSTSSKMATVSGDSSRMHPITGRIRITSYQKKLRPLLHPLVNEVRRAKGHLQPVGLRFQRILSRRLRNWLRTMTRRVSQNI